MIRGKIPALDGLRGIAALLVVLCHLDYIFGSGSWLGRGTLCVDFFFVLSGYVVARSYEHRFLVGLSFTDYAAIRLRRLYPLIALGTVTGCLVALVFDNKSAIYIVTLFTAQLAFVPTVWLVGQTYRLNNIQWSLLVELLLNILHFFTAKSLTVRMLKRYVAIFAFGIIVLSASCGSSNFGSDRATFILGFARGGFGFFAGILMFRVREATPIIKLRWEVIACVLPITIIVATLSNRWYVDAFCVILVMPILCWMGVHCKLPTRAASIASALGRLSYPLYAVHLPVMNLVSKSAIGVSRANVTAAIAAVTVISWLALLLDERLQHWIGGPQDRPETPRILRSDQELPTFRRPSRRRRRVNISRS